MAEEFQINGLEKLVNSSAIKDVYPMVDHIEIRHDDTYISQRGNERIDIHIFLNDPTITRENMYDKELDPHYLVEHHIKSYFPYFNLKNIVMDFIVWGPDGYIVYSWKD
jgi:predicted DNA-binding transcriptional regulator YafY